jgi:hypothetical protein
VSQFADNVTPKHRTCHPATDLGSRRYQLPGCGSGPQARGRLTLTETKPQHPRRSVLNSTRRATSLARIPLRDDAVNVALWANFLPTFSDAMDVDFRIEAIIERASVAQQEVLIDPLALRDGCTLGDVVAAVERGLAIAGLDTQNFRRSRLMASQRINDASRDLTPSLRVSRDRPRQRTPLVGNGASSSWQCVLCSIRVTWGVIAARNQRLLCRSGWDCPLEGNAFLGR